MQIINVLRVGEIEDRMRVYGATHSWDKVDGYLTFFVSDWDRPRDPPYH
jgi:hypothetical protein